jgi:predicted Zn-dependent protease
MMPLMRATNTPRRLNEIRVRVIDDPNINAANAGGGEFQVTTGLLQKANDEHLRGVLAHEIAHDDLGHVARAQTLGTGLNIWRDSARTAFSRQQRGDADRGRIDCK